MFCLLRLAAVAAMIVALFGGMEASAQTGPELVYTRIAPCKAFVVRLNIGQIRDLQITGGGSLSDQGGPAGGCGIPAVAKSVAITLRAFNGSGAGFATLFEAGATKPTVFQLAFPTTQQIVNSVIAPLSTAGQASLYTSQTASFVGDIDGYFAEPIWASVNTDGTSNKKSARVLSTRKLGTGGYEVVIDRDVNYCSKTIDAGGTPYYHYFSTDTNRLRVTIQRRWNVTQTGYTSIPQDKSFELSIRC